MAVVLGSREWPSPTPPRPAEHWEAQQGVCHFHLYVPISDVKPTRTELQTFEALRQRRPRTTLLVFQGLARYQEERNLALQVRRAHGKAVWPASTR